MSTAASRCCWARPRTKECRSTCSHRASRAGWGVQAIQSRDREGAVLEEQPRILLVSVPYALKAADAETLGGKPASAFVLARSDPSRDRKGEGTATSPDGSD